MKKYIATAITTTGLIVFVFGMECSAQSARRLTADIPFDFYVGEERMPKGTYEFHSTGVQANQSGVVVRPVIKSERRSLIVATMAEIAKPDEDSLLVFNRYGSDYFLSRVTLSADEVSFKLRKTYSERETAKQQQAVPVTVRQTVAVRQ